MNLNTTDHEHTEVDAWVEAYEVAFTALAELDLAAFLPGADHPLYREARRELLRVDLELCWQAGRRKMLHDYGIVFPDLLQDRAAVQEIAFEEYRLRVLAGEDPSPAEYESCYGVSTADWPRSTPGLADLPITEVGAMPPALDSKWDFASASTRGDSCPGSHGGAAARALLLEQAQRSDPEAAFLLAQAMTALPEIGTRFLSFLLIAELGRGGFGRVYLARQGDLANRLVALKITIDLLGEEQKLAQLQHTHVVPIYSVHKAGPLQAVCMPYFGATTLAEVIKQLQPALPESGQAVVGAVRARRAAIAGLMQPQARAGSGGGPASGEPASATLKMLDEAAYVDAVLWLAEHLAEGLSHAHERGILHRDLKPANILLTDDGQPMLLDFNLSADAKLRGALDQQRVGGTLPYMSPEQLEALRWSRRAVDARSDVYSLGVILYELLTGRRPFEARPGPLAQTMPSMIADREQASPRVRTWNRAASPAVESIVRHCLQPDPGKRYQTAEQLREDLKRQRQHRPLRFAPEPSLRERTQKWVRRHPRLASPASVIGIAVLLLGLGIAIFAWQTWEEWFADAMGQVKTAQENTDLERKKKLDAEKHAAEVKLKADALRHFHQFGEGLVPTTRPLMESVHMVQVLPEFMKAWQCEEKRLEDAVDRCRDLLGQYRVLHDPHWQTQTLVRDLPAAERDKLLADIAGLLYALGQAEQVRLIRTSELSRHHDPVRALLASRYAGIEPWAGWDAVLQSQLQSAQALNDQARQCFAGGAVPRPIVIQQGEWLKLLGNRQAAERLLAGARAMPLRKGTDDAYWMAGVLAARGEFADALPLLSDVTGQSPNHHGAWLLRGLCYYNYGDLDDALTCFHNCVFLRPAGLWGYYNRGLNALRKEDYSLAQKDFCKVLEMSQIKAVPAASAAVYFQRAIARERMKEYQTAEDDLNKAIALEPRIPELYNSRAQIRDRLGPARKSDAESDRRHVRENTPSSPEGWLCRGIAKCEEDSKGAMTDPAGALADFETALTMVPDDVTALFHKARTLSQGLQRPREAVPVLDRILKLNPKFLEARLMRGLVLASLGRREPALQDAAVFLEEDPSPRSHYMAARIYALTSLIDPRDNGLAIQNLAFALRHGYGIKSYQEDVYLRPLWRLPEFRRLELGLRYLRVDEEKP